MKRTDSASCCVVEPNVASSGGTAGGGVFGEAGAVAVGGVDGAFGAERRGLSGFLSDRIFGAALTAVS